MKILPTKLQALFIELDKYINESKPSFGWNLAQIFESESESGSSKWFHYLRTVDGVQLHEATRQCLPEFLKFAMSELIKDSDQSLQQVIASAIKSDEVPLIKQALAYFLGCFIADYFKAITDILSNPQKENTLPEEQQIVEEFLITHIQDLDVLASLVQFKHIKPSQSTSELYVDPTSLRSQDALKLQQFFDAKLKAKQSLQKTSVKAQSHSSKASIGVLPTHKLIPLMAALIQAHDALMPKATAGLFTASATDTTGSKVIAKILYSLTLPIKANAANLADETYKLIGDFDWSYQQLSDLEKNNIEKNLVSFSSAEKHFLKQLFQVDKNLQQAITSGCVTDVLVWLTSVDVSKVINPTFGLATSAEISSSAEDMASAASAFKVPVQRRKLR